METLWPLTARGPHLERLGHLFLDGAVGGVVLTGPAGVGKTRLGEEALLVAGAGPTARAVGHEAMRAIPLGAFAHLLPPAVAAGVGVADEDRAAAFHRARAVFAELADPQRVVVLVDDVDQLDETSLALLLPLTLDRTIFLIATIRAGRPCPAVVTSLLKDGHLLADEVEPLDRDAVATLLHRVLDGPVEAATVDRLALVSEGNLQVLQELVRRGREQAVLRVEGGEWRLSEIPASAQLDSLVADHVAELDADDRELLDVLAVAGSMSVTDLEHLAEGRSVEALESRRFVRVATQGRRSVVELAHPLYGEVLRRRLSVLRERRLQRRLADGLESRGTRRREDVMRLGLWRLEGGGDVATEVLLSAGRTALIGRDAELATRFAAVASDRGAVHDAARIAVEAAVLAADGEGVERAIAGVWDDPDLPDDHRAHLASRLADMRFARSDLLGALTCLEHAAKLVADAGAVAAIDAQRALVLASAGRPYAALDVVGGVSAADDPRAQIKVAMARSIACASVGRYDEAAAAARLGARLQGGLPPWLARRGMASHLVNEAHAHAYGGWFDRARQLVSAALPVAESSGALAAQVWFRLVLGEVERDCGFGEAARAHFAAAACLATQAGQPAALVWAWVGVAQGHLLLGAVEPAAAALERADAAGDSPLATSWSTRERTRAWLLAGRGDLVGARRLLTEVAARVKEEGIAAFESALLHDLVRFGDPAAAVDRLDELAAYVEGPLVQVRAAHARAATRDDPCALLRVVDEFVAIGALVPAAEAAAEAADSLRRVGDPRAATAAERRAAELVACAGGARTPALLRGDGVEPLTAREREVALLASTGAASRDIAAHLYVSVRTVETHLARAYRKLGVAGRDELAGALAPHAAP